MKSRPLKINLIGMAAFLAVLIATPIRALDYDFSFTSGGMGNSTPGTVTGEIFGLSLNGAQEVPSSIEVFSAPFSISSPVTFGAIGFFSVDSSGNLTSAQDSLYDESGSYYLALDSNTTNLFGVANQSVRTFDSEGFTGVTYTLVASPEPSTWILIFAAVPIFCFGRFLNLRLKI